MGFSSKWHDFLRRRKWVTYLWYARTSYAFGNAILPSDEAGA